MIIKLKGVNKNFGKVKALNNLDLTVKQGEVHGFLGPNGSGKSTTIRVILGLIRANSGIINIFGKEPWKKPANLHKRLAYVPGDVSLWPNLTGGEIIDLLGKLRNGFSEQRRAELIEHFELDPSKKSRTYSKGNRQKVAIIAALCADVELLILDEPTSGLDPLMESVFQKEIIKEKKRGKTVLLSSHIMSEVEALADNISIIRDGTILQTGTLNEMRQQTRTSISANLKKIPAKIHTHLNVHNLTITGNQLTCSVDSNKLDEFIRILSDGGINSLTSEPPSLEELFLKHYTAPSPLGNTKR